jgi:hypothetical protein
MGFIRGGNGTFLVDNAAGTPVDITAYIDNVDWGDRSKDTNETTVFGQSNKTFQGGLKEGAVKVTGKFDTITGGPDATLEALLDVDAPLTVEWRPEGGAATSGKPFKRVEAILDSYVASAPVGGIVTFSASWKASGAFTKGTL